MEMDLSEHPKLDQMHLRGLWRAEVDPSWSSFPELPAPGLLVSSGFFLPSFCKPERGGGIFWSRMEINLSSF